MGFDVCLGRSGGRGEDCLIRCSKRGECCREESRLRRRSRTPFGTRVRSPPCPVILPGKLPDEPSSSKLESNTKSESRTCEVARPADLQTRDQCCSPHLSRSPRDILPPFFSSDRPVFSAHQHTSLLVYKPEPPVLPVRAPCAYKPAPSSAPSS